MAVFGDRVQRHVLRRSARAAAAGRTEGARRRRAAFAAQRRPLPALLAALVTLLALSAPALGMRLGFADAGNDPKTSISRQVYDLLAEGFGPGFNGPLIVTGQADAAADRQLQRALADTDGIAATAPPLPSGDGTLATVLVFPDSAPQDAGIEELVHHLRENVLPGVEKTTRADFHVGGPTAAAQDFADTVAGRLPLFVALVVGLSALLLTAVFRSLLIPVKAALLNLLSIAAALGAITLVFQHGWLGAEPGPVGAFISVSRYAKDSRPPAR